MLCAMLPIIVIQKQKVSRKTGFEEIFQAIP
jgi:hypothetical protein